MRVGVCARLKVFSRPLLPVYRTGRGLAGPHRWLEALVRVVNWVRPVGAAHSRPSRYYQQ